MVRWKVRVSLQILFVTVLYKEKEKKRKISVLIVDLPHVAVIEAT